MVLGASRGRGGGSAGTGAGCRGIGENPRAGPGLPLKITFSPFLSFGVVLPLDIHSEPRACPAKESTDMKKALADTLAHTMGITYTPNGVASGPDGPFRIPTVHVDRWDPAQNRGVACPWGDWYFTLWSSAERDKVSITLRDHAEPDAGYQMCDIPSADVPAFFRDVVMGCHDPLTLIERADAVEAAQ